MKDYIDAKFRPVKRSARERQGSRWIIWLAMTAFIGLLAFHSGMENTGRTLQPDGEITAH